MRGKRIGRERLSVAIEWPGFLMAWVAGSVDAIGYLTLANLFTAHMSGNTAAASAYLGHGKWVEGLRRGFPIPLFVAGVATGAGLDEIGRRRGARLYGRVWVSFVFGAVLGSAVERIWRLWALGLPLAGLLTYVAAQAGGASLQVRTTGSSGKED